MSYHQTLTKDLHWR